MKYLSLILICLFCNSLSWCQKPVLSIGNSNSLFIKSGTVFSADSLVLTPATDLTLTVNTLLETPVAIPWTTPSITRVYYFATPITFTGISQIYYLPAELNGNTEAFLRYDDSTSGGIWTSPANNIVNTTEHYVQTSAVGRIFLAATAGSYTGVPLPFQLLSFTGFYDVDHTHLTWLFDLDQQSGDFTVEKKDNAGNWQGLSIVHGNIAAGAHSYSYNDEDNKFTIRLYRLKITTASNYTTYSHVIRIENSNPANSVRITEKRNSISILFPNEMAMGISIINTLGQVIYTDGTSRNRYDVNRLESGVYIVHYKLDNQFFSRKVFVP